MPFVSILSWSRGSGKGLNKVLDFGAHFVPEEQYAHSGKLNRRF